MTICGIREFPHELVKQLREVARRGCGVNCSIEGEFSECSEAADWIEARAKADANLLLACQFFVEVCKTSPPVDLIRMIGEACARAESAIAQAEARV